MAARLSRLDAELVRRGLARSREDAARLIAAGRVEVHGPGDLVAGHEIRYGGAPGIMYAEGPDADALAGWVSAVHDLRYKDFHCVRKVAPRDGSSPVENSYAAGDHHDGYMSFKEVDTVAAFAGAMEARGLGPWYLQWHDG